MENDVIKLHDEIAKVEKELDRLVENGEEYDKLYEQSIVTDKVIARYLKARKHLEEERKKLIDKYKDELNSPYKEEIISQIQSEVKKDYPDVGEIELDHFSNNVYIYATLSAYKIDNYEIIKQLMYLNNVYFENMKENGEIIDSRIDNNNLKYLENLNKKYLKIMEERI